MRLRTAAARCACGILAGGEGCERPRLTVQAQVGPGPRGRRRPVGRPRKRVGAARPAAAAGTGRTRQRARVAVGAAALRRPAALPGAGAPSSATSSPRSIALRCHSAVGRLGDCRQHLLHGCILAAANDRGRQHRQRGFDLRRRRWRRSQPIDHGQLAAAQAAQRGIDGDRLVAGAPQQLLEQILAGSGRHRAERRGELGANPCDCRRRAAWRFPRRSGVPAGRASARRGGSPSCGLRAACRRGRR